MKTRELNKQEKQILDRLPSEQLKKVKKMSVMKRATKIYNLLPKDKKVRFFQAVNKPNANEEVMKIINECDKETKTRIKEIAGDLIE